LAGSASEDLASRALQVSEVVKVRSPVQLRRRGSRQPLSIRVGVEEFVDEPRELLGSLGSGC
jgi:hypothetical protein